MTARSRSRSCPLASPPAPSYLTATARAEDHVPPAELARWIIEGRADYRLIDLRDEAAFAEYHVPTSENVPLISLSEHGLLRNEKIVLYADGDLPAAQAWLLLRGRGYRGVYTLQGGLAGWKDQVLFPVMPESPTAEDPSLLAGAGALRPPAARCGES